MVRRKRKHGEASLTWNIWNSMWLGLLGLGFCAVMLISVNALWQWVLAGEMTAPPYMHTQPYLDNSRKQPGPAPTVPIVNVKLVDVLPEGAQLVLSNANGEIFANEPNAPQFTSLNLHGDDLTVAPDGKTLAYTRGGKLFVYRNGKEQLAPVAGNPVMPAWDMTGETLAFVIHDSAGDTVYRVSTKTQDVSRLLTIPQIVGPPLTNPGTGRLLIVEKVDTSKTDFYTIDPNCATQSACIASRRDVASVAHAVNWADYHPNAGSIVFSDANDGNLYLLTTGRGDVEMLTTNSGFKRHPEFSRDGNWVAYVNLTDGSKLYVMNLNDKSVRGLPSGNIASFDWAN